MKNVAENKRNTFAADKVGAKTVNQNMNDEFEKQTRTKTISTAINNINS